jgi:hypothetical protein
MEPGTFGQMLLGTPFAVITSCAGSPKSSIERSHAIDAARPWD